MTTSRAAVYLILWICLISEEFVMSYLIRMEIPEMKELWGKLQRDFRSGNISKEYALLYKKWGKSFEAFVTKSAASRFEDT